MKLLANKVRLVTLEELTNELPLVYDKECAKIFFESIKKHKDDNYELITDSFNSIEAIESLREGGFEYSDYRALEFTPNAYVFYNMKAICLNGSYYIEVDENGSWSLYESLYDSDIYESNMKSIDDMCERLGF